MEITTSTAPIFLGFASQKGGVGKSTLAEIISSILYYEKGINLLVVDCDMTQDSFYKLREREKATIADNPELVRQMRTYFKAQGRVAYRVLKSSPENAIATAEEHIKENPQEGIELVIFDFPGHAGTEELLELSQWMDYILSPIEADVQSLASCLTYAKVVWDLGVSMAGARIKDIVLLWNKVDRRVNSAIIRHYSDYITEQGITLLPCRVYAAHRFTHELAAHGIKNVFRSTYIAPAKALREGTGIDELVAELMERIHLTSESHAHD